jgi:hypothetical protein
MAVYGTRSRAILEAAEMVPGEDEKFLYFQRMTITLVVYSYWGERLVIEEVPRDESLLTAITVHYPFARWDLVQMRRGGTITTIYDSIIDSEAQARAVLQLLCNGVKNANHPRKLEVTVTLKNEDDRGDSDAPGGPSARGHPGHQGEDGPEEGPMRSVYVPGHGPVVRAGPADHIHEPELARMRAILEAEDRERDSEEDYATANEEPSEDDADEGDSDDEWEEQTPARPGCVVSGNMSSLLLHMFI